MDFVNIFSFFGVVSIVEFLLKIAVSAVIYLVFHYHSQVYQNHLQMPLYYPNMPSNKNKNNS